VFWKNNDYSTYVNPWVMRFIIIFDSCIILIGLLFSIRDTDRPRESFEEWGFVTIISGFQLLFIGFISWEICWRRCVALKPGGEKLQHYIWLIIGLGFFYMAFDEVFELHEGIDYFIHDQLNMTETDVSDRLDDGIVLGYLVIGLLLLNRAKEEIGRFRESFPYFKKALILVIIMLSIDIIANKKDVIGFFISDRGLRDGVWTSLEILEEIIKLLAGGIILGGTIFCREIAKKLQRKGETRSNGSPEKRAFGDGNDSMENCKGTGTAGAVVFRERSRR